MIAPIINGIPTTLIEQPRWLLWREVERKGRKTKEPRTAKNTLASTTAAGTWAPFNEISAVLEKRPELFDGLGIVLGTLGTGEHVGGIDFDACLNEDGAIADWAQPIVAALLTYTEVSPSETGLKAFFRCRADDAAALREAFGIGGKQWGSKRTVGLPNGKDHGPAIEVYLGPGRYFTVTGRHWPSSPEDVALLDRAALLRVADLVRKTTAAPATPKGTSSKRSPISGRDNTRSAFAFRLGAKLRRHGATFEEMCRGIREHPETAEWYKEKGEANDRRELRNIWQKTDPSSTITVEAGLRHKAADAGMLALQSAQAPFYVRSHALVRVCRATARASDGTVTQIPAVLPVTVPVISRALGRAAQWQRLNKEGEPYKVDPPKEVVEQIACMVDEWPFPPLIGVINTPTMRADGSLLVTPGYDANTGYVLFDPPPMPQIPFKPTRPQALAAINTLNELLAEFPFADEDEEHPISANRSVAMSMLMTPVLRTAFSVVPMHVTTAPEAGTGKSYLQDISAAIATGDRCAVISATGDIDETDKALKGAAMSQSPIIGIDNVSHLLFGDFLCQLIERPILNVRPLGTSDMRRIHNSACVFANGNNLRIRDDAVRRVVQCAMDAKLENPANRKFEGNPVKTVLANRGKYIAAVLTIARAYFAYGRPDKLAPHASFEAWSDTVRSALVWLGWPDPVDTITNVQAEDPVRQNRAAVFSTWAETLVVGIGHKVSEIIKIAEEIETTNQPGLFDGHHKPEPAAARERKYPALFEALCTVAGAKSGPPAIVAERLGRWLNKNLGTIAAGHRLTVDRSDVKRAAWALDPL